MDLEYGADYEAFRREVGTFLAAHWPPKGADAEGTAQDQAHRFRLKAIAEGYLARSIPRRYGGSEQPADVLKATIIREMCHKVLKKVGRNDSPMFVGAL